MIEPILRDVPDRFESERLLIRCPRPGDGAEVHVAITESVAELRPWMAWAHHEQPVEDVEANVAAVAQRAGFTFEARLARNRRDTTGAVTDSLCFARLR